MEVPPQLLGEHDARLTTQGRVTGRRHTAQLWFVPAPGGVHLMSGSGGLTQWCLNLQAEEQGVVRIGDRTWLARAAFLPARHPDREVILRRFHDKYDPPGKDRLDVWMRSAEIAHLVFVREL